jgi:hypothetical protein
MDIGYQLPRSNEWYLDLQLAVTEQRVRLSTKIPNKGNGHCLLCGSFSSINSAGELILSTEHVLLPLFFFS